MQVLRAIDRDEGGNDSTVYFSIPPESSAALNFSVRDSGGRHSIFPSLSVYLLIPFFFFFCSPGRRTLLLSYFFKALNPAFSFSAFLIPSSSFLLFSLSSPPPSQSLCLFSSPCLPLPFFSVSASLFRHPSPSSGGPIVLLCYPPRFYSSLLFAFPYPLHPSSPSPRPHILTVCNEKLLKKSGLLHLIHFNSNWI